MSRSRIALAIVVLAVLAAFFLFDLERFASFAYLKSQQAAIEAFRDEHLALAVIVFFVAYVVMAALSLPGATVMTLAAGALFGLLWGTVLVSFASTIGATLAFLLVRFLFRDAVQRRYGARLAAVNAGVEREGAFYLFTLRLVPAIPFFLINILMALTPIRTLTFYLVSQVGMLAGTIVYINAGVHLADVESPGDVLSFDLIASFTLLGLFPLIAKKIVDAVRARRVFKPFTRPRRFERNLVVIGAGSAGLVCAYIAAAVKARVTLIEQHRMGGDCLNTGCVPSKALIRSAKFIAQARRCERYGVRRASIEFEFADVMERVQRVIAAIEPHDSVARYESLGVECIAGRARVVSPWCVEVDGRALTTRSIVIASGGVPFVPPIPGIESTGYSTSDTLWRLRELPRRLVVLGGGPIGCELAQCFARFGSEVTQVEMMPRILGREDAEISDMIMSRLREEGVAVLVGHRAKAFVEEDGRRVLVCEHQGGEVRIEFDHVLVAVGRKANARGFGLEELGVRFTPAGTIEVNEHMQTRFPNIFACGDVAGPWQFTHMAAHQAWYASVNALFGAVKKFRADYSVVPWATFTDPEVARVGLNEHEAREQGVDYEVTTFAIDELDRAITDEAAEGVVKVLTVPGKDRILGVTIVGEHAGDVIAEYVAAMRHGIGLNKILGTIHIYPTLAEANKYAAGAWKRAHAPARALALMARYHAWRRG